MLLGGFTHSHRPQDTAEERGSGGEGRYRACEREGEWMKREKRHGDEERKEETERKEGARGERESQSGS